MNPRARSVAALYGIAAALFLAVAAGVYIVAVPAVVVLAATGCSHAHGLLCAWRGSPWAVYELFDERGNLIYVGSTGELDERLQGHLNDRDVEPWKHLIRRYTVVRWCRSRRQARRVERRRIRAMWVAEQDVRTVKIHNEGWFGPTSNPVAKVYRWVWMQGYSAETHLRPAVRWLLNSDTAPVPGADAEAEALADEPDTTDDDPEPVTDWRQAPRAELIVATYERPAGRYRSGPILELPAARVDGEPGTRHASRVTPNTPPVGGCGPNSVTRDSAGQRHRDSRSLAELIADAHDRHVRKVNPKAKARRKAPADEPAPAAPPAADGPPGETPDERRKRLARERQQRRRAKRKQDD